MADNHKYPGIDLPLRELDAGEYHISAHPDSTASPSPMLQIREVAMMILMDRLTDKPNWHEKVFDQDIVSKWRQEAMAQSEEDVYNSIVHSGLSFSMPAHTRIITEAAFDYCIAELRGKVDLLKESGLIHTLDAVEFTIIKSDTLVNSDLDQELGRAFNKLLADQASEPDWHPGTDGKVQNLVHPSMYPFVYQRSHFIHQEVVGVADAINKWSGKGKIPLRNLTPPSPPPGMSQMWFRSSLRVPKEYWSEKYQWLPANLAFQEDGTVKFTSYINNLHPNKYPDIYNVIEKLIDISIPAWDHALSSHVVYKDRKDSLGRLLDRELRFDLPPECHEDNEEGAWEPYNRDLLEAAEQEKEIEIDEDEVEDHMQGKHWREIDTADEKTRKQWLEESALELKWKEIREPLFPEPTEFHPVVYNCDTSLKEKFKDTGLQVIVKMASIELTPEKPDFPAGGWHVEGQMNEHIVATALYYVDSENVTPSHLSFRTQTSYDQDELQESVGQDMYHHLEQIYGVSLAPGGDQCLQSYGSVETRQGRLLAFPNTFQHRVSSFSLEDKTKPGHRRFIALWLVSPEMRIISTANVPPQQFDWWFEAVVGANTTAVKGEIPPEVLQLVLDKGASTEGRSKADVAAETLTKLTESHTSRLPPEISNMIRENEALGGLVTVGEARQHRVELMKERSRFHKKSDEEWKTYSFCEH